LRTTRSDHWQRRRNAFNHDWLKNSYLLDLAKWQRLLNDEVEDTLFEKLFLHGKLLEWETHRQEALALVKDYEHAMSPAGLFEQPPLNRVTEETKKWLKPLTHELWKVRCSVDNAVSHVEASIQQVDKTFQPIKQALEQGGEEMTLEDFRVLQDEFSAFRKACLDLGNAFHEFRREVEVT